MAKEYQLQGIVLQSAYTSMNAIAGETFWFVPLGKYLVLNHFDSLSKLCGIHTPVLIIHVEKDFSIPIKHGQTLFEAANEPKKFVSVEGAGHVDIDDAIILNEVKNFFH